MMDSYTHIPPIVPAASPTREDSIASPLSKRATDFFFQHFGPNAQEEREEQKETVDRSIKAMSHFDLMDFARQLHEQRLSVMQHHQGPSEWTEQEEMELLRLVKQQKENEKNEKERKEAVDRPSLPENRANNTATTATADTTATTATTAIIRTRMSSLKNNESQDQDPQRHEMSPNEPHGAVKTGLNGGFYNRSEPISLMDTSFAGIVQAQESVPEIKVVPEITMEMNFKEILENATLATMNSKDMRLDNREDLFPEIDIDRISPLRDEFSVEDSNAKGPGPRRLLSTKAPQGSALLRRVAEREERLGQRSPQSLHSPYSPHSPHNSHHSNNSNTSNTSNNSHTSYSSNTSQHSYNSHNPHNPHNLHDPYPSTGTYNSESLKDAYGPDGSYDPKDDSAPDFVLLPKAPKPTRSMSLFGSLRKATRSRSQSTTSIRGFMRSLGASGGSQRQGRRSHPLSDRKEEISDDESPRKHNKDGNTMSRAAMAVVQHSVVTTQGAPVLDEYQQGNLGLGLSRSVSLQGPKGPHLISQLLIRAVSNRKVTKTVNMNQEKTKNSSERAKVVRRTIIYVPPDSLDAIKSLQAAPASHPHLPLTTTPKTKTHSMAESDMSDVEYSKATKIVRQPSVKRYVSRPCPEPPTQHTTTPLPTQPATPCLNGLEVREMSDGSVQWGIVQKQGNRKSFYTAHPSFVDSQQNTYTGDISEESESREEEEEEEEERVLALMGLQPQKSPPTMGSQLSVPPPVPRKSSRRLTDPSGKTKSHHYSPIYEQDAHAEHIATTHGRNALPTDIYYAPEMTLDGLVEMISLARPATEISVEEQLNQVIESFRCHHP
ncbi:hypothetical protein BDF14DRAFT_1497638 [Spinellus fusiger]|nr:hypothetical protein BDF14DRAFT_1497638 [Spinellus fusiger]